MIMHLSTSSMFSEYGYDPDSLTLAVRYPPSKKGPGRLYHYEGIPQELWDTLRTAKSFGKAFHALVKDVYLGIPVPEQVEEREMPPLPDEAPPERGRA